MYWSDVNLMTSRLFCSTDRYACKLHLSCLGSLFGAVFEIEVCIIRVSWKESRSWIKSGTTAHGCRTVALKSYET
jgi:hypothetical protein